ncbi:hypothetical protein PDIDSM_7867 [Penicillium digitatum]|nr:hypothetical protein PDIDSM_7867 [Penicillium digitatum]
MSVVGSNRPDVHHVLLPSAAAKTSGSPETVKPVTVPVVALAFLPVRNMPGASHVYEQSRRVCHRCRRRQVSHVQLPIPSTYPYRDASANVNTRSLFAIPAHCPIPKFKTTGDAYDTRASDISLSPDWNTRNTSAAPYATLLQLMWRSPSTVPSKVPVLWSL